MTQEDLNEVLGKSLANYQLRQLAEDGGNLESALTLIDRLESELLNVQEHAQNLEFLLNQKDEKISQLEAKAEAYDRVMSGGKKTLKEWANIFGKPIVVDSDDTILVFSSVPRYEGGYSQEGEFIDDWIGEIIAHIDCEYEGEYVDDVTLPDGWEEK